MRGVRRPAWGRAGVVGLFAAALGACGPPESPAAGAAVGAGVGADVDPGADMGGPGDVGGPGDAGAVGDAGGATPDGAGPSDAVADGVGPADVGGADAVLGPVAAPPSAALNLGAFATSLQCGQCHASGEAAAALRDAAGRPVGMLDLWRSTMMGSAARDPYWRAVVSAEIARRPAVREAIEHKCMRCHVPMSSAQAALDGVDPPGLDVLAAATPEGTIARDGVSCTVCHQITTKGLGAEESWSGGFAIAADRIAYGPHQDFFATPMLNQSSFTPTTGPHIRASALCGTCHTLFTGAMDADGAPTGEVLPEQTPYLEWRNSDFVDEGELVGSSAATCQACHVPKTDADGVPLSTRVARRPDGKDFPTIPDRDIGRHLFVGGNTLVAAMIRDVAALVAPDVPAAAYDATIGAAREQLQQRTATLQMGPATWKDGVLSAEVGVGNLAGHKLPTAYPSRRIFLRLRALDGAGATVASLGEVDGAGRLVVGGAPRSEELAGGGTLPHRDTIDAWDQVQVWETVLGDADGAPTFSLLSAGRYLKDDRILPLGWAADGPHADVTAPVGVDGDGDFGPGRDVVTFHLPLATAPAKVVATLLYQPIAPRHVAELAAVQTDEVAIFLGLWSQADRTPETLATASAVVEP